ncbi:MAG TPA: TadE/TadG family type IV pilus assembly protein [Rhizomicrobium sp.]|jgi:Flp pilus assembly protein TadG|nr:TadE/TadG family type IV pilus assembly protein [Rhizomicrobium sp.]
MSRIFGSKSFRRSNLARASLCSESGVAAIEFAFLAPVLLLMIAGVCQFTMVLGNYMTLEHAVGAGARTLAISRGDSTPVTDTQTQVYASAGNLTASNITISYSVNGTSCSSDTGCGAALAAGVPAQVTATYPCSLVVMGTNFAPGCTLSVGATERVE